MERMRLFGRVEGMPQPRMHSLKLSTSSLSLRVGASKLRQQQLVHCVDRVTRRLLLPPTWVLSKLVRLHERVELQEGSQLSKRSDGNGPVISRICCGENVREAVGQEGCIFLK